MIIKKWRESEKGGKWNATEFGSYKNGYNFVNFRDVELKFGEAVAVNHP